MTKSLEFTVELGQREVQLLLRYGYPFEPARVQLEVFKDSPGPHRLMIDAYYLSLMIGDLVRSAKKLRSAALLDEIDALCSVLENTEQNELRRRRVK